MYIKKRKAFNLLETIVAMIVTAYAITLITHSLYLIRNLDVVYKLNEDKAFIRQMQLLYVLGERIELKEGMLSFDYANQNMYFTFEHNKLILKEGYQVLLNDINDVYFEKTNNCIYLKYKRKEWRNEIIGCE